jgi:hypothetical protein
MADDSLCVIVQTAKSRTQGAATFALRISLHGRLLCSWWSSPQWQTDGQKLCNCRAINLLWLLAHVDCFKVTLFVRTCCIHCRRAVKGVKLQIWQCWYSSCVGHRGVLLLLLREMFGNKSGFIPGYPNPSLTPEFKSYCRPVRRGFKFTAPLDPLNTVEHP